MGVELHLQRLKPRFSQSFFQLDALPLTLQRFSVKEKYMSHRHNHPVSQKIELDGFEKKRLKSLLEGDRLSLPVALPLSDQGPKQDVNDGKNQARGQMQK